MSSSDSYFHDSYIFKNFIPSRAGKKRIDQNISKDVEGTPIHHILQDYFASNNLNPYTYSDLLQSYRNFAGTNHVSDNDQNHLGIKIGNNLNYANKKDKNTIHKAYKVIFILYHRFSIPYDIFIPKEKSCFLLGEYRRKPNHRFTQKNENTNHSKIDFNLS